METLGQRLRELRLKQGITQKQLAEKVGIREATLSRYENDRRDTQWDILSRIADALNTSTDFLLCKTQMSLPLNLLTKDMQLSKEHIDLISKYEGLSKVNKMLIWERIETLIDTQKK